MNPIVRFLRWAAVPVLVFTACTREFSPVAGDERRVPAREFTAMEKGLLRSSNAFGFGLFRQVCGQEGEKTVFVSPLSVSMALGMTLNGAAGPTADEMRAALGFGGMAQADVNASYRGLLDLLPVLDPVTTVEIANSVWIRQEFPALPGFVDVNRESFDAAVRNLDFNSASAPDVMNAWISEKTHGKIGGMIGPIDPLTVMFLINAVYFKGTWSVEFDPRSTRDDEFIRSDGTRIPCRMMENKASFAYFETEAFQAADLRYGNGRFSMTLFLPKPGSSLNAFMAEFNPDHWNAWKEAFVERELSLFLPKFKVKYEVQLNDVLSDLGMGIAFDPARADFSGINPDFDLYISSVKHKTFVEVDEKGTEAAAATVVEVGATSVGSVVAMRVDRPFVFLIREKTSGAILFMGRIETL
jgi:serine protease inhibitor